MDIKLEKTKLGFFTVSNKPNPKELSDYYKRKYFQENVSSSYQNQYSAEELEYVEKSLSVRWEILSGIFNRELTDCQVLDIGCGEGFFLNYARRRGAKIFGVDYSCSGMQAHNPQLLPYLTVDDLNSYVSNKIAEEKKYDVIWCSNVLEHVLDPVALLLSFKKLIAKNGIVVITVPNDFSIIQNTALRLGHIKEKFWVTVPDHLHYFCKDSLKSICEHTNWEIIDLISDFPVDFFLYNKLSNYIDNKASEAGSLAHMSRIQLSNLINSQSIETVIDFWRAAASIGIGRDLTIFIRST